MIPMDSVSQRFVSHCLQVLDSATVSSAIYILSCLCPQGVDVILDLVRLDLSEPHQHEAPRNEYTYVASSFNAEIISCLWTYTNAIPREEYARLWLEIVQHWLFTCPLDEEYDQPDISGEDRYCQKLRSELVDRIMHFD